MMYAKHTNENWSAYYNFDQLKFRYMYNYIQELLIHETINRNIEITTGQIIKMTIEQFAHNEADSHTAQNLF